MFKFNLLKKICSIILMLTMVSACSNAANVTNESSTTDESKVSKGAPVGSENISKDGYTLIFVNQDPELNPTTKQKLIDTFFTVYPQLTDRFNQKASKTVMFTVDPTYKDVAYAVGNSVKFAAKWLKNNPNDSDCATHELMHVTQSYPTYLVWLTEGIADYARHKYGVNNSAGGWSLPAFSPEHHYTDSYRITARFLVWAEEKVNSNLVNELDKKLRDNTYSEESWKELTGKTVDELWAMYAENPSLN